MKSRYDTYCGLYCGACAFLLVNERGEVEEKAKAWKLKPEEMKCRGCKTEIVQPCCRTCSIKRCAETRGLDFCCECNEYPCGRLVEFRKDEYPHHSVVLRNLETIRKKGVDDWLREQKSRWICPHCGERFSWYDEVCGVCGERLFNCGDEEKDLEE